MSAASGSKKTSFNLSIYITSLSTEKSVEVTGDTHIGKLMLDLVEGLDITADWSDHGLWWPQKRMWLLRPRLTLNTCGVQGDAKLHFTPMHKKVRVQLPDLQYVEISMNFSKRVFNSVQDLCAELGVKHPEELSMQRVRDIKTGGRKNSTNVKGRKKRKNSTSSQSSDDALSTNSDDKQLRGSKDSLTQNYGSMPRYHTSNGSASPNSPGSLGLGFGSEGSFAGTIETTSLAISPSTPSPEALASLSKPRTLVEKAYMNGGWLDSSRSLMEQEVREFDTLLLRFKYFTFFDLNPKVDEVRINQLYEQAKWTILTEDIECTEEEMMTFAAIQFQVKLQSASPQPQVPADENDDIDTAIDDLQKQLEGSSGILGSVPQKSLTSVPEIKDYLNFVKQKYFGMKSYKKQWFVFKETILSMYKSQEESFGSPIQKINVRGCEITPDVNVSKDKYNIKLRQSDGEEMTMSCISESQYSKWMAACRLASKGKTMADSSYDAEVSGIQAFLSMQHHKGDSTPTSPGQLNIQPEDFVGQRLLKKYKSKQIAARILEAHSSLTRTSLLESKMLYIRQWQSLPEFGVTHFTVRFRGEKQGKKEEVLGIAFNRMMKMHPDTKESLKTWRYSVMRSWNVNWETKEMIVQCEDELVAFNCTCADIKAIHEFIGGYIFLSMRKDVNQPPKEELFFKLTGGWV